MIQLATADYIDSHWFQALSVFVSFNTIIYGTLALAKLSPRKRR